MCKFWIEKCDANSKHTRLNEKRVLLINKLFIFTKYRNIKENTKTPKTIVTKVYLHKQLRTWVINLKNKIFVSQNVENKHCM